MSRFLAAGLWLLLISVASAQDARRIVTESQDRSRAKSERYEGTLETTGPSNKAGLKRWTYQRIGSFGASKAILRFTAPPELKGLAVLIVNHPDRAADQWMWTPAIERERRVAPQDRSTRFFGTDFSFEDLEERDINLFDFKMLGEEPIDGAPCWKIESKPQESKSSQYTSSMLWIRKDNSVMAQIENFSNAMLVRRIHYSDLEKVDNIWTPRTVEVFDAGRKSRTVLRLEKLQYNTPMKDDDFTLEALRRGSP